MSKLKLTEKLYPKKILLEMTVLRECGTAHKYTTEVLVGEECKPFAVKNDPNYDGSDTPDIELAAKLHYDLGQLLSLYQDGYTNTSARDVDENQDYVVVETSYNQDMFYLLKTTCDAHITFDKQTEDPDEPILSLKEMNLQLEKESNHDTVIQEVLSQADSAALENELAVEKSKPKRKSK